jgi:hypothetical protein
VRSVPTWEDASSRNQGEFLERVRPSWLGGHIGPAERGAVRPAWLGGQTAPQKSGWSGFRGGESSGFSSGGHGSGGWQGESAGGKFARRSPPRAQYGDGRSRSFEMERRDGSRSSFHGVGPLQLERDGSLIVVTVVVFVEVALIGEMFWSVLTPLSSKWLGTCFTLLVLTPVVSCLFAHVLNFRLGT